MNTRELAEKLVGKDFRIIYNELLQFLEEFISLKERDGDDEREFAFKENYFWLPCIICGHWHSGREWRKAKFPRVKMNNHQGRGICGSEECMKELKKIEELFPEGVKCP